MKASFSELLKNTDSKNNKCEEIHATHKGEVTEDSGHKRGHKVTRKKAGNTQQIIIKLKVVSS
jgi:hypothetical protein